MHISTSDQGFLAVLVDGEPDTSGFDVAIDAALRDAGLRSRYERYLMIGQALRGEPLYAGARGLSARVAERTDREPVLLAQQRRRRPHQHSRPMVALALAASLAVVAVVLAPLVVPTDAPQDTSIADASQPSALAGRAAAENALASGFASGATAVADEAVADVVEQWSLGEPSDSTPLDVLLVDHRERASATGLRGFIPYAAVVSHGTLR